MTSQLSSRPSTTPASLFFIAAVAFTVGWTAVSSELGRLSLAFGPQILLLCNLAYFLPSLPILVLQLFYDEHCNTKFGGFRSNCWRAVAGFGGCTLVAATYPFHPETRPWLLASVSLLGVSSSIALGSCHQLAAQQPPPATVALSLGYVCSGPLLLVVEAALKLRPDCAWGQILVLYETVAVISACGLAASVLAQLQFYGRQHSVGSAPRPAPPCRWQVREGGDGNGDTDNTFREPLLDGFASSEGGFEGGGGGVAGSALLASPQAQGLEVVAGLEGGGHPSSSGGGRDGGDAAASSMGRGAAAAVEGREAAGRGRRWGREQAGGEDGWRGGAAAGGEGVRWGVYRLVLSRVWPVAVAITVSVGTSMLLFPLFTYVPSSGWLGMMLPQALFWTRVFSDAAGRLVPRIAPLTRPSCLLALAGLKLALTPLLVLYIRGAHTPLLPALGRVSGDAAALAFVAVQWLLSGYVNSCCFLTAPLLVPPHLGTKAASTMTLVFQGGSLLGLLAAIPIRQTAVAQ